mmetsp:Transcript_110293/g.225483  ORF Transcript_110293/g.225483 Transcript_110293/m.225483 type:complete len:306 (-) Transcript_110293:71-988(-)
MLALFVLTWSSLGVVGALDSPANGPHIHALAADPSCGDYDESGHDTTMLLQMKHRLERGETQHVSILETCPLDKFQSSLAWMLENKLLLESSITNSAQTRYLELAEQQQCELGPDWYVSEKPLVINVGDGSTATRWLAEIMGMLGFNTYHYGGLIGGTWDATFRFSNTSEADMFDFIADTPTSTLTWELVQSHPNALFLMTMRDPVEWRDSRIKDHIGEPDLTQGLPCGVASLLDANNPAAETYVAYSAWAKCVIPEDQFLGAVNVFADENNDAEFVKKLIQQLEAHGLQKSDWENRTARVMATL